MKTFFATKVFVIAGMALLAADSGSNGPMVLSLEPDHPNPFNDRTS
jgi:hypothetical protein